MTFSVKVAINENLSVDPSYIVKYQVYENNKFIGDGVAQYHRMAEHNNFHIPETIVNLDNKPLTEKIKNEIKTKIFDEVTNYID